MRFPWPPDTISRIAVGIAALVVLCLMGLDYAFGLVPNPVRVEIDRRQAVSQLLADQIALVATRLGPPDVHQFLYSARRNESKLLGMALRSAAGDAVSITGVTPPRVGANFRSTSTHVRVPVMLQGQPWGALELNWQPIAAEAFPDMLLTPQSLWPMLTFLLLTVLLRLYLGKVLHQLDPSAAVPERVSRAYNTLSESVIMLDGQGRIVLLNEAFRVLVGQRSVLVGRRLEEHDWLREGAELQDGSGYPWTLALQTNTACTRMPMKLRLGGDLHVTLVTCSPITERNKALGCLVVISDQTYIERSNESLRLTTSQLQSANDEIQQKNAELTRLATRDPMTDCLNRRAFFEIAGARKDQCNLVGQPVAAIMCDIDHFKSFNDRYGHAIGDEVIKAVAGLYNTAAEPVGLACRYGGEEFCLLLPGFDEAKAGVFAEMLRKRVQDTAGDGIDYEPRLSITSSFGVAVTRSPRLALEQLVDQADQALYQSKRAGRNRCTLFEQRQPETIGTDSTA
ncbi:diguanylate cyclase [Sphaerotilus sp.]|uniref:sensor domain-containing diguanylate cyclase n=1 Tax=Sphaerotilus sp. TaxID=2093942 RepID=UPI00286DA33E|nr:diguanylate cyclase [Sphaerotilus sp.]